MTYLEAQVAGQMVAMAIFLALAVGIAVYTFWPANKAKFDRAARLPLESDNN